MAAILDNEYTFFSFSFALIEILVHVPKILLMLWLYTYHSSSKKLNHYIGIIMSALY